MGHRRKGTDMTTSTAVEAAKRLGPGALALAVGLGLAVPALAANLSELALPGGPVATTAKPISQTPGRTASAFVDPSLLRARGEVEVWVKLADRPLAEAHGANARTRGGVLSLQQRRDYLRELDRKQADLSSTAGRMGARELGRVARAHNAVALRIDASRIADLASLPGVVAVRPVRNYELALSDTVPYIGAAAAQAAGKDGTGARVAVLDSGIDYTHRNLGGPGTAAAYAEAVATFPNAWFPSGKVVGGFDFVGSKWPGTTAAPEPRTEDPNPIDDGAGGGHGTHVSDIIAGRSLDGTHVGVAPGAQLYALKVCSSVSTSCNGVALLKAVDFALDPDGDGSMKDAVDVMNLSLGSNYGQKEDDLSEALDQAVHFGVVVVAAAGNAGNRPYIVSSPSTAPGVISVAQTQVPSAKAYPLVVNSPAAIAGTYRNTETVEWSPVDHPVTGDVAFVGRGCPAGTISATNPDDPYLADPAGKIALIDRGGCAISWKIDRAVAAGATGVLIGLVAPGDAISFSYGGGTHFAPTLIIIQADSNRIKGALATGPVNATISPANAIPLVGSMVSSSARGPSVSYNAIKPEIGAPGASVSAQYGTGTGQTAFGGTSGATPMVAGSAAILVGAIRGIEPMEVKARLMNTAETQILHNPALAPGYLAPITRIGAGEVRVDKALGASSAAWVRSADSAALSFGYQAVSRTAWFDQTVRVENLGNRSKTYAIASSFRYAGKEASGAVEVRAPRSIRVGGRSSEEFRVTIVVHPEKLPVWNINGGSRGGSGATLDGLEMDGYLTLTSGSEKLSLPWQVLPHRAAALYTGDEVQAGRFLNVFNAGVADGLAEVFSLTGRSSRIPRSQLPRPGDNFAVIDLRAVGVRLADPDTIQFGIGTSSPRAHPNYPAEFDIYIDKDLDGAPDFVLFNAELGGFGVTGQNVVYVVDLATGVATAYYYIDADLDSTNAILTAPLSVMGMTADSQFNFSIYAFDNYFTGALTDAVENMTYTPSRPRYAASTDQLAVPSHSVASLSVDAVAGGAQASPSQTGLLLLFRDSDPQLESQVVRVHE
jgi:subtilisin family serine protease